MNLTPQPYQLFNRRLLILKQRRFPFPSFHTIDQEIGKTLQERLMGIKRTFRKILILGRGGTFYQSLFSEAEVVVYDHHVQLDDEFLPFPAQTFDLVISHLSWHWVNDLPGTLAQVRHILQPDGLLLAALFGGNSLWQLRQCLSNAEEHLLGGVCPRVAPMITTHDGAALLQRAGFALPVADHDQRTFSYDSLPALFKDLRYYGQTNMLLQQPKGIPPRQLFALTEHFYREKFGFLDGKLPVSANIIYLTGWSPCSSQPQPLLPGSGQINLQQILS